MKLKIGQTYINKKTGKEAVITKISDSHVFRKMQGKMTIENFMELYEVKKNINNK